MKIKPTDVIIGGLFGIIAAQATEHIIPTVVMLIVGTMVANAFRNLPGPRDESQFILEPETE